MRLLISMFELFENKAHLSLNPLYACILVGLTDINCSFDTLKLVVSISRSLICLLQLLSQILVSLSQLIFGFSELILHVFNLFDYFGIQRLFSFVSLFVLGKIAYVLPHDYDFLFEVENFLL